MMDKTHYEMLGVSDGCRPEEITKGEQSRLVVVDAFRLATEALTFQQFDLVFRALPFEST